MAPFIAIAALRQSQGERGHLWRHYQGMVLDPVIYMSQRVLAEDYDAILFHERVHIYQERALGLAFWGPMLFQYVANNNRDPDVWEIMARWVQHYFYPNS